MPLATEILQKAKSTYCTYNPGCPIDSKHRYPAACDSCLRQLKNSFKERILWIDRELEYRNRKTNESME